MLNDKLWSEDTSCRKSLAGQGLNRSLAGSDSGKAIAFAAAG